MTGAGAEATQGTLTSIVECARALLGADAVRLRLHDGRICAMAGVPNAIDPAPPGSTSNGFQAAEAVIGADGRHLGTLDVMAGDLGRSFKDAGEATLHHLAGIAAGVLSEQAEFECRLSRAGESFALSPNPSWIYDPVSLRFVDVNEAAVRSYGYSRAQFRAMTVLDIRPPQERGGTIEAAPATTDDTQQSICRHRLADGRDIEVAVYRSIVTHRGRCAVLVAAIDQSHVEALRRRVCEAQVLHDSIIAALPIGLFVKDMGDDGRYLIYNPSISRIAKQPEGKVVGRTDLEVFGETQGSLFIGQDLGVMESGGQRVFEEDSVTLDSGETRNLHTVKKPLPTADGSPPRYLLGLCEDVTERRRSEARIAHMARYDFLTDLPNRVMFQQHLGRTLTRRRKPNAIALIYLDLDYFKIINDTYGHQTGDLLLQSVATRLKACLRRGDVVARLGGDEFAIVAPLRGGEAEALALANRVLSSFDTAFELGECVAHVDTSIGIALSTIEGRGGSETLMRHADIALHAAKAEGRGLAKVYAHRMSQHVEARQRLSEDLRRALVHGEFKLDFQPILDLGTDRITGFEALVRWRHPTRGLIAPGDFIPVAEQTGLIVPIGDWVLGEACRTAAKWPAGIKVAVNLSAVQFRKTELVASIERTLAATGLSPDRLEVEITESVLLAENGANLAVLHSLRALGVKIAMDDFGTGYSSLSYLRSFPFDKIKMDRSFVTDVCESDGSLAIVRAVTGLGSSLSITTTAEGIETPEQFARLKAEGFDELQGYLIGRPMAAARATALALSQTHRAKEATAA